MCRTEVRVAFTGDGDTFANVFQRSLSVLARLGTVRGCDGSHDNAPDGRVRFVVEFFDSQRADTVPDRLNAVVGVTKVEMNNHE